MTKTLFAFGLICATLVSGHAAAQKAGLAGKWATDAVYTVTMGSENSSGGFGCGGFGGGDCGGRVERPSSPDGAALIVELRLDKIGLSGSVLEFVTGASTVLESAAIDGMKFEFVVYKRINNVKAGMSYRGELVDEGTIVLRRFNLSGKPVDTKADGTSEALVFHRLRDSELPSRPERPAPRPWLQLVFLPATIRQA